MSQFPSTAESGEHSITGAQEASIKGVHQGRRYRLLKRKKPSGELSPMWYVNFEIKGKQVFQSTGTASIGAAKLVAQKKVGAAMAGRWEALNAGKLRQDAPTLGTLIAEFEAKMPARAKISLRTIGGYVSSLRVMIRTVHGDVVKMEDLRATVLTRELVMKFKEARYPQKGTHGEIDTAVTTANSTMSQARALFSRVALELYKDAGFKVPDLTGFLAVRKFKDDRDVSFRPIEPKVLAAMDAAAWGLLKPDVKRALHDEHGRVIDARLVPARPDVLLAYLMARWLGMRDIEIANARWSWIERYPEGWRMAIMRREYFRPKYSEGKVPMSKELYAALDKHGDHDSIWIIPARTMTERHDAVYRDSNFFLRRWLSDREKGMHELRKQAGSQIYTQTKSLSMAAEFLRNQEETCRKHYATLLVPPPALKMTLRGT